MKTCRLGVYGGTFDPIHTGHLVIAQGIAGHCGLDRVLFIPSARPPHKQGHAIASPEDRFRMAELAIRHHPRFEISDLEIARPGLSYTVDTLVELGRIHGPASSLFLVIGADSLLEIDTWYAPDRIFELATVVTVPRPGRELTGVDPRWWDRVVTVQLPEIEISSTEIRRRVGEGLPIDDMVPGDVAEYIASRGLYGAGGTREA